MSVNVNKRNTVSPNEEIFENNPMYGYGDISDDIEIVDQNPYYGTATEDPDDEIRDENPYYGQTEILDDNDDKQSMTTH